MSRKQNTTTARDEKRAQFEQPKSRAALHLTLAGIALVALIAVAALVVLNRGGAETATATAAAPGGDVVIPLTQVEDGRAHFYSFDAGGTTVKYFVLADKKGEVRAALDAALSERRPALVECLLDIDEKVLPMVPSGKPIEELILEPPED